MPHAKKSTEAAVIARIRAAFRASSKPARELRLGLGDDAAFLRMAPRRELVVSTDNFIEDVHFHCHQHPPEAVGYKALVRATSDLVAKGSSPRWFLLSLGLPLQKSGQWLGRMLAGMARAAREFRMAIIGGDTTRCDKVFMNLTVFGEVPQGQAILRTGASPGDLIYMTGHPGAAALGLEMVREGANWRNASPARRPFLKAHLFPTIESRFARWLAANKIPTSMMDVSDGLSSDLARLCMANGLGAILWKDAIVKIAVPQSIAGPRDALTLALHGGDDYSLLFTMKPGRRRAFSRSRWAAKAANIGVLTSGRALHLQDRTGSKKPLLPLGWDPFRV